MSKRSVAERFWAKVAKDNTPHACWLRFAAGNITKVALGREFGVTDTAIAYVVNGVTWRAPAA